MRLRHAGLLNRYLDVADAEGEIPGLVHDRGMTRGMALLWFWRVKSWKWSGNFFWDSVDFGTGSGSFSGLVLDSIGTLRFPALDGSGAAYTQEKDLLHRQNIVTSNGGSGTGDLTSIAINLELCVGGITRYRDPGSNDYETRYIVPTIEITASLPIGPVNSPDGIMFGADMAGPLYLSQDFGSDPAFGGFIQCEPNSWYPYLDRDGVAIWDEGTGAQLGDPRL